MDRFAVYYAPAPGDSLHVAGSSWMGRDAVMGTAAAAVESRGAFSAVQMDEFTTFARRYGFHATLKPPMPLREGVSEAQFIEAVAGIAAATAPFTMPPLDVASIDGFLALVPGAPCAPLDALAERCVRELDEWRRPYLDDEIERRAGPNYTPRQRELLARWGYPYVLDEFRFHMTLSRRLATHTLAALSEQAARHFEAACAAERMLTSLAVFVEREAPADFVQLQSIDLGG